MKILHRFTAITLFEDASVELRDTIVAAVKAGANLAGADLADAYLADADLAGAYLADANLADANLAGADLADAYLADADLAGAYLAGAYLADAKNVPADVASSDLTVPYERKPAKERYAERAVRFRQSNPTVPVVELLDAKILNAIESGKGRLDMSQWHTCKTTHCRAGWAITLAGKAGSDLEDLHGPERAGAMIYRASTGRVPYFFASNEQALKDIREQAALQS